MTSLVFLIAPLIGCYTYRAVFFNFAIFMDCFLKLAVPSSSLAVAPPEGPNWCQPLITIVDTIYLIGWIEPKLPFDRCQACLKCKWRQAWVNWDTTPLLMGFNCKTVEILQWEELTRNNHCRKNGFFVLRNSLFLSCNYRENRYIGREIRYFDRKTTAKFAKFG